MITTDQIADRLGWEGKDRGKRVRRLLAKLEATTGKRLLVDLGPHARPRYWVEESARVDAFPTMVQDIQGDADARVSELLDEIESLRELVLGLVRRVRAIEERRQA